jgi:MoaA/NifB/PqqE/SkfB family radical SAM enzyme
MLAALDAEFRAGALALKSPPTRFYLNLTEVCQLRCVHCITRAPELTERGRARNMTEAVLDRLRPHLRHAAYVGFTHAGEPMIAPLFTPALEAVKEARAGLATSIHLLSNGVALTPARFEELIALGVNSFSISIDGMSGAVNDVLRVGSRIELLLPRIEALSRARPPSVRIGIAWTVTGSNHREIPALIRFAKRVGLDWVKLEEMFPISIIARLEMLSPPELARVATEACALAEEIGIPLLDHTVNRRVWKCRPEGSEGPGADPLAARFGALDDFVNRMEINSCRFPLEVVCIEPNGDVKPVSFLNPSAGNLLETDLLEIWNSPPFVAERARMMQNRLCGAGPVICPSDPGPERW